jgi:glycosyltransferase involved in cell wall biosynthesis
LGCEAAVSADFASQQQRQFDVVVVRHPQADPELVDGLVACAALGTRVILDVDMDYAHLPPHHADKARLGLGTSKKAKAYSTALRLSNLVCVASQPLAHAMRGAGHPVMVMPPGWTRQNRLWAKAPPARDTLNVGWLGAPGQMEDVAEIRRPLLRVLREFPQTHLVIGGDPLVYALFKALPRERRQYLPPVSFEEMAYLLSQVDVLLVPLRSTPFNKGRSDVRLMEAGVRGIPWIASPLPAYEAWGEGGLLARTPDDWYAALRALVTDAAKRAALGEAGRQQAEEREMGRLGPAWLEMIDKVWRGPKDRSLA